MEVAALTEATKKDSEVALVLPGKLGIGNGLVGLGVLPELVLPPEPVEPPEPDGKPGIGKGRVKPGFEPPPPPPPPN